VLPSRELGQVTDTLFSTGPLRVPLKGRRRSKSTGSRRTDLGTGKGGDWRGGGSLVPGRGGGGPARVIAVQGESPSRRGREKSNQLPKKMFQKRSPKEQPKKGEKEERMGKGLCRKRGSEGNVTVHLLF